MYQPALSDLDALRGDWIKIGQDLSRVLISESRNSERAGIKRYKPEPARNVVGSKVVLDKEDFPSDQA